MNRFIKILVSIIGLLTSFTMGAQNNVEMADGFRADGKIYVVVVVVLVVLFGLFAYLFVTDTKLKKLEQEVKNKA